MTLGLSCGGVVGLFPTDGVEFHADEFYGSLSIEQPLENDINTENVAILGETSGLKWPH